MNGDLYVTVRVRPEKGFERDGEDIRSVAEISFVQAALGDAVTVATVEDPVTLKIPAGTQSGAVFKLRGRGAYALRPDGSRGGRGDQLVKVIVRTPAKLSRTEKKLYEELRRLE